MRIGTGDEFLRTTGGTLTGALTISANADPLLTLNRPDGAGHVAIATQLGGGVIYRISTQPVEPVLHIYNAALADLLTIRSDTSLLGAGRIPLSMLRRDEASGTSGIAITLLAADTDIVSVATAVDVAVGDRVLVWARAATITKGATAGATKIAVTQSAGTATGVFINAGTSLAQDDAQIAGEVSQRIFASVYVITGAGTLTMKLVGSSAGSNATLAAGGGLMRLLTLRDSA